MRHAGAGLAVEDVQGNVNCRVSVCGVFGVGLLLTADAVSKLR